MLAGVAAQRVLSLVADLGASRDVELKELIGQSRYSLEIGARERRAASLRIAGRQADDPERVAVRGNFEPVILGLARLGIEAQTIGSISSRVAPAHVEVSGDVAFPHQEENGTGCLIVVRYGVLY